MFWYLHFGFYFHISVILCCTWKVALLFWYFCIFFHLSLEIYLLLWAQHVLICVLVSIFSLQVIFWEYCPLVSQSSITSMSLFVYIALTDIVIAIWVSLAWIYMYTVCTLLPVNNALSQSEWAPVCFKLYSVCEIFY